MTAGGNPAEHAALRINRQPVISGTPYSKQKTSKPEGERRLADAARPAQQYRMWEPPCLGQSAQFALGAGMAEEIWVLSGRKHASRPSLAPLPSR